MAKASYFNVQATILEALTNDAVSACQIRELNNELTKTYQNYLVAANSYGERMDKEEEVDKFAKLNHEIDLLDDKYMETTDLICEYLKGNKCITSETDIKQASPP